MNLSIIYILAFSSIITFAMWLLVIMFVLIFKPRKNAKAQKEKPHKLHVNTPPPSPKPSSRPTNPQTTVTFTQEEGTRSTGDTKPMAENPDNQSSAPQIKIDNKETLRKAIIYHEILDTKF
ncbi:MAG: hypothetical protein MJ002_09085 [Paludibacteraceae bacterium]|nr:hypothetical protein [Paludibacteraceae bacterium]